MPKTMGRPPHVPTDQMRKRVGMMVAYGIKRQFMPEILGVSDDVLQKYYKHELDCGLEEANEQVARSLFKIATSDQKGNVAAAIFWLKTKAKWRTSDVEAMMEEMETLRAKLQLAEERLARLGAPKLAA